MARGGEPRAGPGLRLGPRRRGLLPRHRTRPALALLSRPGAAAGRLPVHPGGRAGAGGGPPAAEPLRRPPGPPGNTAALRHVHVFLRLAHAGRVFVPASPAPVDWPLRGRRLDGRLSLDLDAARHHHRPARRGQPRRDACRLLRPELRLGPQVSERDHRVPAGERRPGTTGPALARAGGRAGRGRARPRQPRPLLLAKVVEAAAERDEALGRVGREAVGVLFGDLVGLTTMAEEMTPEEVMALLRDFHGRMEEEVFRHGGCLEKFIGDALLATFGVPDTGRRDATDALACARGMLAALAAWNVEREAAGLQPLQMGLGLHYGPVVAGDIGSRRSMAYATVGDTTNVTSRLQSLTRELRVAIVASAALVAAVEQEAADLTLLHGLTSRGPSVLRGRDTPIELWAQ